MEILSKYHGIFIREDIGLYVLIHNRNWRKDPFEFYKNIFEKIIPTDTIEITRSGKTAYYAFVYHIKEYKDSFPAPFNNN